MSSWQETYQLWLRLTESDPELHAELVAITDPSELEDRFYRDLSFGTGGLRGVMGAGTNRMNGYVVRKATSGLAEYLLLKDEARACSVAVAYDTRSHSEEFALTAALTLCEKGICVYMFPQPEPTPILSFATRCMHCAAGIVITASHNPKEYNGYKVYDSSGCQIVPDIAEKVGKCIDSVDITKTKLMDQHKAREAGLLKDLSDEVQKAFLSAVMEQAHPLSEQSAGNLTVVYTPLHGTGKTPVEQILRRRGFNVALVAEQSDLNGAFPTVKTPNPEDRDALNLGIRDAGRIGADIVLGTDPDCDRVGVAVRDEGEKYLLLTGNQIGALLVNYVLTRREGMLTARDTVVKTIVTSELGARIAHKHGLHTADTLTGFKYIGEQAGKYEQSGEYSFLMGYEESYGYLVGTHARDKDAVVSSMLICEMTAFYKEQGKTLADVLEELYSVYGYYLDALDSFTCTGIDGSAKIVSFMEALRADGLTLPDDSIVRTVDYMQGVDGLPKENVVKFIYASGSWIAVRPSGTEPKLKVYYSICGLDRERAEHTLGMARKEAAYRIGQ